MTRSIKLLACVLLVAVVLWACAGGAYDETTTTTETYRVVRSGQHFREFSSGIDLEYFGFGVFAHNGKEIFTVTDIGTRVPQYNYIDDDLLRVDMHVGTGMRAFWFFDLVQGIHSPRYYNVIAADHGLVFHFEWPGAAKLVVHNIFNPQENRFYPQIDIWDGHWYDMPTQAQALSLEVSSFIRTAEFISPTQLYVEYLNADGEFVSETITLQ
ncbi:MAG: hypothetical protein FWE40_03670 [Oscillospiraceae bacterium]|jgi:hypothetical protein|nr:hypothetical protein [Oscillospiraceae bacterium]